MPDGSMTDDMKKIKDHALEFYYNILNQNHAHADPYFETTRGPGGKWLLFASELLFGGSGKRNANVTIKIEHSG
ncbi:hypothetical protein Taro_016249 [Colocasia esculenta]|uniref:Uncharacterized protein n=1 Tax=Colocasia esculenta TaxID=4460 RepID=A0A843UVP9_COLES|nr:hypothetical protein [Colocasia esculenta]